MAGIFSAEPVTFLYISAAIGIVVTLLSFAFGKKLSEGGKWTFFLLIAIPILLSSLYMGAHTVNKNLNSATGGPVHWHIDYQVFVCDERLDLINPTGLKNKIGSPLFHEHNDDRVHVEGTVSNLEDVDLRSYFQVIGGDLTPTSLTYIDEEQGEVTVENGDLCNGEESTLKVYINGDLVEDPTSHVPYPNPLVPPGDCVIVDFSPSSSPTTDRICESWQAQEWNYNNYEQKREDGDW